MQLESAFQRKVEKFLKRLGTVCWAEKIQQVGKRGTPDILVCLNGHFVALELKRHQGAFTSKLQVHKLNMISRAGGYAAKVYPENWEEIKTWLTTIGETDGNIKVRKLIK